MTIWLFALMLTAIACATLFYAGSGRAVNATSSTSEALQSHFRGQLQSIETDASAGRLGPAEAVAAKAELAREVLRLKGEVSPVASRSSGALATWAAIGLVAVLALGSYAYLGRPDLPSEPLAGRDQAEENGLDLEGAVKTIEARLTANPDDLRGWQVVAPAYIQLGRYPDAVRALRRVNELATPTADSLTDLGEALMLQNGGSVAGEPLKLFQQAAALDPKHVRSHYYIAGEETRAGDYVAAERDWTALIALGKGDEPWMTTARNGLAYTEAALHPATAAPSAPPGGAQIEAMVDGLEARLKGQGGTLDEWTQLVRSRLVQGRTADAQADYDAARKAFPDASQRAALDQFAAENALVAK